MLAFIVKLSFVTGEFTIAFHWFVLEICHWKMNPDQDDLWTRSKCFQENDGIQPQQKYAKLNNPHIPLPPLKKNKGKVCKIGVSFPHNLCVHTEDRIFIETRLFLRQRNYPFLRNIIMENKKLIFLAKLYISKSSR